MVTEKKWAFGIDAGGTKVDIAAVDSQGIVLFKERIPTRVKDGPESIINDICTVVKKIQKEIATPPVGAGVGMPGQIDPITGVVYFAPNLKWREVPLKQELENILKMPIAVLNDVRAITWGEWKFGAGKGCNDLVSLFIGTGVGGGIITKGSLLVGMNNCAGELGHMTIDLNGPPCTCGNWGCVESYSGGWAIAKNAKNALLNEPEADSLIEKIAEEQEEEISAEIVIKAYHQGDLLAASIIDQAIQGIIAGSVTLVNAFNPERMIFGGGIVEALPELIGKVNLGVRERALSAATQNLQIVGSKLGREAGVIGAADYIMNLSL